VLLSHNAGEWYWLAYQKRRGFSCYTITEVWNAWRKEHPNVSPDLAEADLHGAFLTRADLSTTNLQRVNLQGANLREQGSEGRISEGRAL
jgi:hypothetical protein